MAVDADHFLNDMSTGGVDLTFARTRPQILKRMSIPKLHQKDVSTGGRSIPRFAKVPATKGCECWNWVTSGVAAAFAAVHG
jgi:hypothetical protein